MCDSFGQNIILGSFYFLWTIVRGARLCAENRNTYYYYSGLVFQKWVCTFSHPLIHSKRFDALVFESWFNLAPNFNTSSEDLISSLYSIRESNKDYAFITETRGCRDLYIESIDTNLRIKILVFWVCRWYRCCCRLENYYKLIGTGTIRVLNQSFSTRTWIMSHHTIQYFNSSVFLYPQE